MDNTKRGALMALLKAAREWGGHRLTLPTTDRGRALEAGLAHAVYATGNIQITDLDPAVAVFRGQALVDLLDGLEQLTRSDEPIWGLDFMVDEEGLKIMVNGTHWSPGHGSIQKRS